MEQKPMRLDQRYFVRFMANPGRCCWTFRKLNSHMMENIRVQREDEVAKALDEKFHETLHRYREVIKDRKALMDEFPAIVYPVNKIVLKKSNKK